MDSSSDTLRSSLVRRCRSRTHVYSHFRFATKYLQRLNCSSIEAFSRTMASAGQPTTSDDMSLDGDVEERQQSSWNMGGTSVAMARPTTLTTVRSLWSKFDNTRLPMLGCWSNDRHVCICCFLFKGNPIKYQCYSLERRSHFDDTIASGYATTNISSRSIILIESSRHHNYQPRCPRSKQCRQSSRRFPCTSSWCLARRLGSLVWIRLKSDVVRQCICCSGYGSVKTDHWLSTRHQ